MNCDEEKSRLSLAGFYDQLVFLFRIREIDDT